MSSTTSPSPSKSARTTPVPSATRAAPDFPLRSRSFDSTTGRFLSVDPLGLASGDSNFYRYVANSPVNHVDPDGLKVGNYIYSDGSTVYANTGVFDTFLGNERGNEVVRNLGGVEFAVAWDQLSTFTNRYWDMTPNGFSSPVRSWGRTEWNAWFSQYGARAESSFIPNGPAPSLWSPTSPTTNAQYLAAKQQQKLAKELAHRKRLEGFLQRATEDVLSGAWPIPSDLAVGVVKPDGSAKFVNPRIDPRCAQQIQDGNPGCQAIDPAGNALPGGMQATVVTAAMLKEAIQRRYQQIVKIENGKWTVEDVILFGVGFVPFLGEAVDIIQALNAAAEEDYLAATVITAGIFIPLVGGAFLGRFMKRAVSTSADFAVEISDDALATARKNSRVGVQVKVLDGISESAAAIPGGFSTSSGSPSCSKPFASGDIASGTSPSMSGAGIPDPGQLPLQPPKPAPDPHPDLVPVGPPDPPPPPKSDPASPYNNPKPFFPVPKTVIITVFDSAEGLPMGGPKNGVYVAYHGTNTSGAASLSQGGINSKVLKNPDEFQMAINPADAARYGADEAKEMGGCVKIVRYEIPEEMFLKLYSDGHIRPYSTTGSLVFDQAAQQAINHAMGN